MSKKRQSCATQQKAEINKLEMRSQLGRNWEKLLLENFGNELRAASSAKLLMTNPFTRKEGQLLLTCCLPEVLTSCDKLNLGNKCLHVYRMMLQYVTRDDSGLSLARRKDATYLLRWIMSVIPDAVKQACVTVGHIWKFDLEQCKRRDFGLN